MNNFRTELQVSKLPFEINHQQRILSMGSCFVEQMGNRLTRLKFPHLLNPFGIVYHPLVLAHQLEELTREHPSLQAEAVFESHGLWRHFSFHSRYARPKRADMVELVHEQLRTARAFVEQLDVLILTFGTADVYRLVETGNFVSNCHKLPQSAFVKERSSVGDIVKGLQPVLDELHDLRPKLQVVLTVSPVRHLRDGLVSNQRSKAILLLAAAELSAQNDYVNYFPAYELLLDDLRDYRFYGPDMLHPSPAAIDYIWNQFIGAAWSTETHALCKRIDKLVQAAEHRPLHADSEVFRAFQQRQREAVAEFAEQHPNLDFGMELTKLL